MSIPISPPSPRGIGFVHNEISNLINGLSQNKFYIDDIILNGLT